MFLVIGSNMTEAHPVASTFLKNAVANGAQLIVVDPRKHKLCDFAALHLPLKVGSDIALLNAIMHVLITEDLYDRQFVESCTMGFDDLKEKVMNYPPERASGYLRHRAGNHSDAARRLAATKPVMLCYTLGITEHTCGKNNVMTTANLQMLLGNMGMECGGVNPLRGQNNVQGACDMGALPNVFPGYQPVTNPDAPCKIRKGLGGEKAFRATRVDDAADDGRSCQQEDQGVLHLRRKSGQFRARHPKSRARTCFCGISRLPGYFSNGNHPLCACDLPGSGLERKRRHFLQQ